MAKRACVSVTLVGLLILLLPAGPAPQGQIIPHNKVTGVVASFAHSEFIGGDQVRLDFKARIIVNAYGRVRYRWVRSDGGMGAPVEINFAAAGSRDVTTAWTMGTAHSGETVWMAVRILYPNEMESNRARCTVPSPEFRILGVLNEVKPTSWKGRCPVTFQATGHIEASGKGTARYRWIRSDGGKSRVHDLVFEGPGKKTVTSSWTLSALQPNEPARRWIAVEVLYPNHILPSSAGSINLATAPIPGVAAFDCECVFITPNPRSPAGLEVSLSGMGIEPTYNCNLPSFHSETGKWFKGKVTVRNLSANPLTLRKQEVGYVTTRMNVLVLHPQNEEALGTTPVWPHVYSDKRWPAFPLMYPDVLAGHGQFETQLGICFDVFKGHPIVYIGAIYRDETSGQTIVSNLVKWEARL